MFPELTCDPSGQGVRRDVEDAGVRTPVGQDEGHLVQALYWDLQVRRAGGSLEGGDGLPVGGELGAQCDRS